mmetsp:Transcript_29303/g.82671  ORF Transcript_29303/g.82671 Transcript_29303/m.82671 type:complete len:210 (+) Transcript_29303:160-789(+)
MLHNGGGVGMREQYRGHAASGRGALQHLRGEPCGDGLALLPRHLPQGGPCSILPLGHKHALVAHVAEHVLQVLGHRLGELLAVIPCALLQGCESPHPDFGEGGESTQHPQALQQGLAEHVDGKAQCAVNFRCASALCAVQHRRQLADQRQQHLLEDHAPGLGRQVQPFRQLGAHDAMEDNHGVVPEVGVRLIQHWLAERLDEGQPHACV